VEAPLVPARSVLKQLKQKQRIVLVDIRRPEEFQAVRIPGALNIALHFIKTKAFLKEAPVVLVDGGYPDRLTDAACRELNAKGFRASILKGGLLAWQRRGGPLQGDLFSLERYRHISSVKFYQEKDRQDQVVIDVSSNRQPESMRLFPNALHLPFPKGFTPGKLRTAAVKKGGAPYFLIFNESGEQYGEIEKRMAQTDLEKVFYLDGGIKGYQTYVARQALLQQPRDSRIKKTAGCNPCGQKKEILRRR